MQWINHKIEISTLLLFVCTVYSCRQSKVEISQNFVAFSEYTNFIKVTGPFDTFEVLRTFLKSLDYPIPDTYPKFKSNKK